VTGVKKNSMKSTLDKNHFITESYMMKDVFAQMWGVKNTKAAC